MTLRLFKILALSGFLALPFTNLSAQTAPEFNADRSRLTSEGVELEGNAHLVYGEARLDADSISYSPNKRTALAKGNVILTRGAQRLLAAEIYYELDTNKYRVTDLRFGSSPVYASGSGLEGEGANVTLKDAIVSYGEPDPLAPTMSADTLRFVGGDKLEATGVKLGIGPVRPIVLTDLSQDINQPWFQYLNARAGYRSSLGAFLDVSALVPFGANLDLGADVGIFTSRGVLFGPTIGYHGGDDLSGFKGSLTAGYIHDSGDREDDILGNPIQADRGFVNWTHRQTIDERLSLNANITYWSDSEVVRDFKPDQFFGVQTPDSYVEGLYVGGNYVVGLFARLQPNTYHQVQERLPELTFELLPVSLPAGFYERFEAGVAILREDDPAGLSDTLKSERYDAYYLLSRPIAASKWLTLTPVAGARVTHYGRTEGDYGDYTRTLGEFGADLEMRISGVSDYKNERWGIDGIRHLVTPKISYRYVPESSDGNAFIPMIDRTAFDTYLQPLGLGNRRDIDSLSGSHITRFELDNTWQTRDAEYGSRDLLRLNFAADLNLEPEADEDDWSAVHTSLAFLPASWMQWEVYSRVAPQDGSLEELNTGLTLRSARDWQLRLANHYLKGEIQEYITEVTYQLNEVYGLLARVHYDTRENRFVEQVYGIRQNLRNRWDVRYQVSIYEGPRRESSFGLSIELDLITF